MREILFKAKRKDNGEWVEGYVVFCNGKINPGQAYIAPVISSIIALEDWAGLRLGPFVEVYPETVCQYTGLTDKNGERIFENDVLVYEDDYTSKTKCTVKYINSSFQAVWSNDWDNETLDNGFKVYSEVIGNIYDGEENHG